MPAEIIVPELGESVLEATVARWLKREGENVSVGDTLVELETDKVNLEVSASASGVLARIERQEGEDVQVGDVLGAIEEEPAGAAPDRSAGDGQAKVATPSQDGEQAVEPAAEPAAEQEAQPLEPQAEGTQEQAQPAAPGTAQEQAAQTGEERVTPVAARLARERGVDLNQVRGSGPGGRVTRGDVEAFLDGGGKPEQKAGAPEKQAAQKQAGQPQERSQPAAGGGEFKPVPQAAPDGRELVSGREERIKMSRRRRTIASRLVEAQQTAAMLTTFNEIDMTAVMELRSRRNEAFQERHGVKIGFTSFFVKASIGALKAFPRLNAEVQGDEMVLKHYYDIGIAVGDPEGLVVPVLRDADSLSFAGIERLVKEYAAKAQEGRLTLEDLRGGTFTITNGGVFGSLLSTPILSYPQVSILGLHKIEKRPIAVDDQVVIRPMMYVALTYDHRIVDGREAVQFLVRVKELIEDPETLLLEG